MSFLVIVRCPLDPEGNDICTLCSRTVYVDPTARTKIDAGCAPACTECRLAS